MHASIYPFGHIGAAHHGLVQEVRCWLQLPLELLRRRVSPRRGAVRVLVCVRDGCVNGVCMDGISFP